MGMYTEIYVNVDFDKNLPDKVIEVLKAMCHNPENFDLLYFMEEEELPIRWAMLFNDGSCYTPKTSVAKFGKDWASSTYSLLGKGDIKNYEEEIEKFFKYIAPYVYGPEYEKTFVGYLRYEEYIEPTLVYVDMDREVKFVAGKE